MLQQNNKKPVPPPKPPIAAKPKNIQKTNFIIVGAENQSQAKFAASRNGKSAEHQPLLPHKAPNDANHFSLPSSPPSYSDCANDCCGILNNKQLECIQRQKNNKNGNHSNGAVENENGSGFRHRNERENDNRKNAMDKHFKTSSQSFDSSSSSSGGFRDSDYITKTKVAYELFDRDETCTEAPYQTPIGHSKVQEMKSKLFAQQQQQQNHTNIEPSIAINRQQYQKSSKELEKVLGLRIEKKTPTYTIQDKSMKRLSKSFDDAQENSVAAISNQIGANISKQIQQKLTEEMKQQCEMIKEKFLIETVPVQQHYKDFTVHSEWKQSLDLSSFCLV